MIGRKIKILRELHNYTQEYVASQLGISQNAYSRIELNQTKISVDYAEKLAELFKIPLSDLLSKEEPVFSFPKSKSEEQAVGAPFDLQKFAIENITRAKDQTIEALTQEIRYLRKQNSQLLSLLAKKDR